MKIKTTTWPLVLGTMLLLLAGPSASAQEEAEGSDTSALRTRISKPGLVVISRRAILAPVATLDGGQIKVSAVGAFEPGLEEHRILGLRIDLEAAALPAAERTHYLDLHEIEALLRGLSLLEQLAAEGRTDLESEADYQTVEGFTIGVVVQAGQPHYWVAGGRQERVRARLSREGIGQLRGRLEEARERLFQD